MVLVQRRETRHDDVLGRPLGRRQLRHRRDRPVGYQSEQHPLHRGGESPVGHRLLQRGRDAKLAPEPVEQPRPTDRPGVGHVHRPRTGRQARLALASGFAVAEVRPDRGGQPQQPVDVDPVDSTQVHQHLWHHRTADPVVVRQRDVAHNRAVGVPPLREPQVHVHTQCHLQILKG